MTYPKQAELEQWFKQLQESDPDFYRNSKPAAGAQLVVNSLCEGFPVPTDQPDHAANGARAWLIDQELYPTPKSWDSDETAVNKTRISSEFDRGINAAFEKAVELAPEHAQRVPTESGVTNG